MAATSRAAAALEQLHDMHDEFTECTLCSDIYTDPRMLPCLHTYCLKCLMTYSKESRPGSCVGCPMCRKQFALPESELPKNFFIDRLAELRKVCTNSKTTKPCDVCLAHNDGNRLVIPSSTTYCADCALKMCPECGKHHAKQPLSKKHKQVSLALEHREQLREAIKSRPAYCDKHVERLRLFCSSCSSAICLMCFALEHKFHNCSDIEDQAMHSWKSLDEHTQSVSALIQRNKDLAQLCTQKRDAFLIQLTQVEQDVCLRAEELKRMIDNSKESLLQELNSLKTEKTTELDSIKSIMDLNIGLLESYKQFALELRQCGSHVDVTRLSTRLKERKLELEKLPLPYVPDMSMEFIKSNQQFTANNAFILGNLKVTAKGQQQPKCRKCGNQLTGQSGTLRPQSQGAPYSRQSSSEPHPIASCANHLCSRCAPL